MNFIRFFVFLFISLSGLNTHAKISNFEIPIRVKSDFCQPDSMNCIIWIGLLMPLSIKDTLLPTPYFKSSDIEIQRNDTAFIPLGTLKEIKSPVAVELYNVVGIDTLKIKTFYFKVKAVPNPALAVSGKLLQNTISKSSLLNTEKIEVLLGCGLDSIWKFELTSFEMEIDGKEFKSQSGKLTPPMKFYIARSKEKKITIKNDRAELLNTDGVSRLVCKSKTFQLVD